MTMSNWNDVDGERVLAPRLELESGDKAITLRGPRSIVTDLRSERQFRMFVREGDSIVTPIDVHISLLLTLPGLRFLDVREISAQVPRELASH